jgi:20S proteasome subunit beta 7
LPPTTLVSYFYNLTDRNLRVASYGSLARFKDIQRLHPLGEQTVIGVAGDMSDYQYLQKQLDGLL